MADAEAQEEERCWFDALPLSLVRAYILASLPVDARLCAAGVCRAWRGALVACSLWAHLDLSWESGVRDQFCIDSLLLAAAARAGGELQSLDVSARSNFTLHGLRTVVAANAGALRVLRLNRALTHEATQILGEGCGAFKELDTLLRAAPALEVVYADALNCSVKNATRLLRGEHPFEPLRLETLQAVCITHNADDDDRGEAAVLALAGALFQHARSLSRLTLECAPLDLPHVPRQ
jgi:hypothetical protein